MTDTAPSVAELFGDGPEYPTGVYIRRADGDVVPAEVTYAGYDAERGLECFATVNVRLLPGDVMGWEYLPQRTLIRAEGVEPVWRA
ncbi:hypothetical protein SEA_ALEEMILY_41 [Gordonia phage Aleemily]|uniref:Uncharacterized protein n=2 Tax=Cafassovirus TaxID=3425056 RepID=A0A9E7QCA2_9CAUD|nr:hypothetical protein SEA_CAFASSO_42 [Gordonia phage Cafasso]UVK59781.1 hypothetical protein SEA_ALEEMILY_41 [Gordonia phage Aleemily]